MMGKLGQEIVRSIGHSNLRYMKVKEDRVEIFMTHIIMTEEIAETDIDPIVMIGEINMNRIEVGQNMNKITGKKILKATRDHINILEDRIVENTGVIIGMKTTVETEVGVSLWKGYFGEMTILVGEMIEAIGIVDLGLDQEQVQTGTGLDAIKAENMTILQRIVLYPKRKEK